jgi:hypothetical protein
MSDKHLLAELARRLTETFQCSMCDSWRSTAQGFVLHMKKSHQVKISLAEIGYLALKRYQKEKESMPHA